MSRQIIGAPIGTFNHTDCRTYKIIGLNKKGKTGIYATVEYNGEDWFHADFDPEVFPIDRQYALFDMYKNNDGITFSETSPVATIKADKFLDNGYPVNPIIKVLYLDI